MRNRAWRRAQDRRVIRKRLKIAKQWDYWKPVSGKLRKWNFTCDCEMCSMSKYFTRRDKAKREIARTAQFTDYI